MHNRKRSGEMKKPLVVRLIKFMRLPMDGMPYNAAAASAADSANDDDIVPSLIKSIPYNYHLGLHFEKQKCNFSIKDINASPHTHTRFNQYYDFMRPGTMNTPCAHFSSISLRPASVDMAN